MKISSDDGDSLSIKRIALFFDSTLKISPFSNSDYNFNFTCDSNMKNPIC